MAGPMDGVRVVELGVWIAAPAAAGILADWGADVVKIEPPGGDPARLFQRLLGGELPTNPPFELDNRSKRGVCVDLARPEGRELALELVADADVFVTNVRRPALRRLGLDHETLTDLHPRLVYAISTGYGLDGPDADRAAFDIGAFWSRAGIASLLTPPGADPPFQRGGMGDHTTAMATVGAVCAALLERHRTGEGQVVATSLLRQGAYTVSFDLNMALMWGQVPAVGHRATIGNPAIGNYLSADGRRFWVIGVDADRHWPPLARVAGHPEWLDDERYATAEGRAAHATELIAELDRVFAGRTMDEWVEVFDTEPDMFWAPVNSIDDVLADEQFHASGALVDVPDGSTGTTMVATPVDFHGTPWAPRALAPRLGQHTAEVLTELGRTADDIAALEEAGVIVCG